MHGWIKHHKGTNGESVRCVIITGEVDDRVKYALLVSSGVTFYTSKVSFDLVEENTFSAGADPSTLPPRIYSRRSDQDRSAPARQNPRPFTQDKPRPYRIQSWFHQHDRR